MDEEEEEEEEEEHYLNVSSPADMRMGEIAAARRVARRGRPIRVTENPRACLEWI